MNGLRLFGKEIQRIFKDKKLLIPIIVILFVPLIYSGMFLWSFKDPYAKMDQLPVAVVNNDKGAEMEGDSLHLGNELTDKLKDSDAFDFHIVSEDKAMSGLDDLTYYMVVKIPEDFSENATTLLEDQPKKLELEYIPNDSYNFLASQIGETAINKVKTALSEEVSKTYAETLFSRVKEMAKGFQESEKGTGKLNDGTVSLLDGGQQLKDNLQLLASKSIEFQNGMESAESGSSTLAAGSNSLSNGLGQLYTAGGQLLDGSKELGEGANVLSNKMQEANAGVQQISGNVPKLISGTQQVQDGLAALQSALPEQLAKQLTGKSGEIVTGMQQVNEAIDSGLTNELAPQLTEGLSKSVAQQVSDIIAKNQQQQMVNLQNILEDKNVEPEKINEIMQALASNSSSKESLQKNLYDSLKPGFQKGIDAGIQQTVKGIDNGFAQYEEEVGQQLTASNMEKHISDAINPVMGQLSEGLNEVNKGQMALQSGVGQLADGFTQLGAGAAQFSNGEDQWMKNMELFISKLGEAEDGANELTNGATQLNSGLQQLLAGSSQLSNGSQQLADGADQLSNGINELQEGTDELHSKMKEAADKTGSINADNSTYGMMANPVKLDTEHVNKVPNYGTGFAPYFISLGLFVGALILTIIFPMVDPAGKPRNGFSWFLSKFGIMASIGIIQSVFVDVIVLYVLDIEVQSVPFFFLFTMITSLAFIALIQALVTWGDNPGRFICIIILILQLTSSAGTFPLEVVPKEVQWFNPILPMTYSVQGFKAVISSGDYGFMWQNAGILLLFVVASILFTHIYFTWKFKKQFKNEELVKEHSTSVEYSVQRI